MSEKRKFYVHVACRMRVTVCVEADSEDDIERWLRDDASSVLSVIETPLHEASDVKLDELGEVTSDWGFYPDIILPTQAMIDAAKEETAL